jgi:hypothetical protein
MHEYLAPLRQKYVHCRRCGKRTAYTCVRCGYCYLCHPIAERVDARAA